MNSKKYQALNEKLDKVIADYAEALDRLEKRRSAAAAKLDKAYADRAEAMTDGDLEKARKNKLIISDLESDVEVFTAQIDRLNGKEKSDLVDLANSIKDQVNKEEAVQHQKDRAEIIKKAQEILTFLDSMEEGLQTGNDLILKAMTAAGLEDQCDKQASYFSMLHGKKLLIQLRRIAQDIVNAAEGKSVQGLSAVDIDKWL